MPKIEIDGITVDAEPGTTIIEVADRLSIHIPRFCFHNKLSVAANCRMCLVQVSKSSKALPACATPVADGMQVWTTSKETKAAQQAVMEYLLINHPLDCPICDQGGECELQDISMQYGRGSSRFNEPKRAVLDQNLGPLISTEMTRCIHCTRCVRFGSEISGERELGVTDRGENVEIGTYVAQTMNSEVSGNVIDLCPVGALTSKPYRFTARAWELRAVAGVSPHDCIGSNLYWHTLNNKIMRVVPKDKEELNEVWLSDRDRFSYESLYHHERIRKPRILSKRGGDVNWAEAFRYTVEGLRKCIENYGPDMLGILVSPNVSTEELYLLKKLAESIGCTNIDHRLRVLDFSNQDYAPITPDLGIDFANLANQNAILLIGCNVAKEQPLASVRLRKMVKNGGKVFAINTINYKYNFDVYNKSVVALSDFVYTVASLAKALLQITKANVNDNLKKILADVEVNDETVAIANGLLGYSKKHIILGEIATMHPESSKLWFLVDLIAKITNSTFGAFSNGANAAGAWLAGCIPHRLMNGKPASKVGKNALEMLQTPLKGYILYGVEPLYDSILGSGTTDILQKSEFIVAINSFHSDSLQDVANIILPVACPGEYDGSFVNVNGTLQNINQAVEPFGESRPGWKILKLLADMLGLTGFDYMNLSEVQVDMKRDINFNGMRSAWREYSVANITKSSSKEIMRMGPVALYAIDAITRRAKSLQQTMDANSEPSIFLNSQTAKHLNISDNELVLVANIGSTEQIKLYVIIDDNIANNTAVVYQANPHTVTLGAPYCAIEVRKC